MTARHARQFVAALAAIELRNARDADAITSRVTNPKDLERCEQAANDLIAELTRRSGHDEDFGILDPALYGVVP